MSTIEKIEQKLHSFQEFINIIQDKQLQNALKLSNTKSVKVDGETYTKKPLTSKQFTEISKLNTQLKYEQNEEQQIDILVKLRTIAAEYFFDIPAEIFDKNFEKLNPIMEGCILKTVSGLSPDINFDELLVQYQSQFNRK